jgi:hypothetical protein
MVFDYCGKCGKAEICDEEAQLTPQGKRASWSGNQHTHTEIATMYTKTKKKFMKKG